MDIRRFVMIALLVCAIPYLGCSSKSGSNRLQSSSGPALSKSSTTAPFNDPRYQDLVRQIEEDGGISKVPAESESTTAKIGSAMKKATVSVAGALTPKPKVIKAPDAVSLDSMPEKINVDVYYQAGRLAECNGNAAAAVKQYTRALEEDPKHMPSLISLARLYDRQDKFEQAQKLYRQAIEAEPQNAMAYNDLGLCLGRNDRGDESVAALKQAIQLQPHRKLYRNNLATVLVELGRVEEAWEELNRAHSAAVAHYNVGYLLYQKGDKQQARRRFALAYANDKSLSVAKDMLARLDGKPADNSAPTGKVRYRVDDMVAGPVTPTSKGPPAQPVTMVISPPELRRIPVPESGTASDSAELPNARLSEPACSGPAQEATELPTPDLFN